jgi:DNA-binding HxlR family transcriptional regulator
MSIVLKDECVSIKTYFPFILTNKGMDLVPILDSLCSWGEVYAEGKEISVCSDPESFLLK